MSMNPLEWFTEPEKPPMQQPSATVVNEDVEGKSTKKRYPQPAQRFDIDEDLRLGMFGKLG